MQLVGLPLLIFVIWFGFSERDFDKISAFDSHALVMVLVGCIAAILSSSSVTTAWRTLTCLRELIPNFGLLHAQTGELERERTEVREYWMQGERAQALNLTEGSDSPVLKKLVDLVVKRAPDASIDTAFMELRHAELSRWQPAVSNWELLSKLGPSFGMVGTITGMIQLFKTMGTDNLNIGAAMSLALIATLYGVAFGAGVAGPIGHFLRERLDEKLGAIERCEQTTRELIAMSRSDARRAGV